ncbi:hypothetical protein F7P85_06035 [Kerstersia gyiorum]|nr:hypothetical protein [Kerstersia gyiorum]KAB0544173.1 hypothetical protein F7P85_06035 [Kerstersia gyiorum]
MIALEGFIDQLGPRLKEMEIDPYDYFMESFFLPRFDDDDLDGDKDVDEFTALVQAKDEKTINNSMIFVLSFICTFVMQAIKAQRVEKGSALAWSYAASAQHWAGIFISSPKGEGANTDAASRMAHKRHEENYGMRADIEQYWRKNIDPALSAQKAADQIIKDNVAPLSHKKIAEIVSALRKAEALRKA